MLEVIGTSSSDEARERVDVDELVRQGAQRMLVSALEDEVDEYVRRRGVAGVNAPAFVERSTHDNKLAAPAFFVSPGLMPRPSPSSAPQ